MMGGRRWLGRSMICLQFAGSAMLVITALTLEGQIDFLKTKDLGFDGDQVAMVNALTNEDQLDRLRSEVEAGHIVAVAGAAPAPGFGTYPRRWVRDGETTFISGFAVSHDFVRTLGLRLQAGEKALDVLDEAQRFAIEQR